ncbi:MAG: methyltransferase domain-containing protein [Flavobacteriales bacterium]|nr:methyltransferase domain-containing protein [Flavobacteriales bacterium]
MQDQEVLEPKTAQASNGAAPHRSTANQHLNAEQGHWLLARMGKKVLRPGGKELTMLLMGKLAISPTDELVEFAPGLGFTAGIALQKNPKSYTGVELNEEAAGILRKQIKGKGREIVIGNACCCPLKNATADKVYGEAMLTMQADHRKAEIIREAHRILRPGGLYGIHEIALTPDSMPEAGKKQIQHDLATTIKVNARPLTQAEWTTMLEAEGFTVESVMTNPMHLLETARIIDDEGFFRTLKITWNILTHPKARKRILEMRKVFRRHEASMSAIAIVARKK